MTDYFEVLHQCLSSVDKNSLKEVENIIQDTRSIGSKLIFIGNGGSAAIASHLATDFTKNGGIQAISFNDAATMSCTANDYGWENVFAKQLDFHGNQLDVLIAISSSGRSPNILKAVEMADLLSITTITLSGFDEDNPLREKGDVNLYIPSHDYGIVEVCHLAIMHSLVGKA